MSSSLENSPGWKRREKVSKYSRAGSDFFLHSFFARFRIIAADLLLLLDLIPFSSAGCLFSGCFGCG